MYKPVSVPPSTRVSENGTRFYVTPEGYKYPSVTSIFSIIKNESIEKWKQSIGAREADLVSRRATSRGTWIHSQCESLIKGVPFTSDAVSKMLYGSMWESFKPVVSKIGDVYALETQLYSDRLRTAGTVDCIGMWNGELSVIDFKTSGRYKRHEDIDTYWMQTAAYSCMFYEHTGMSPKQLVILMAVEDSDPLVYIDKTSNWVQSFIELRKRYQEIHGI